MAVIQCPLCCIAGGQAATPFEYLFPELEREDQIVAERSLALAAVDVAPVGLGHCIVMSRAHRLSMADCLKSEIDDVEDLAFTMGGVIFRATDLPFVMFEHGQRSEDDHPFGCSIVHAHLHVVATTRSPVLDLESISGVDFQPYEGGLAALDDVVRGEHYLFVRSMDGRAWLAQPTRTPSQLLRRHFLDAQDSDRDLMWNWSDQSLLSHHLQTRKRILENLGILRPPLCRPESPASIPGRVASTDRTSEPATIKSAP